MTYKTQLKKRVLAGLLAGTALWLGMPAALAASGVVPNTQLPQGGHFIYGGNTIEGIKLDTDNAQMTITQNAQNAVIQWDKGFNVGANATVNFKGPESGYNTLNYDASGNMSQIYGAINAINDNNKGNIYIVNPAGVEISSSAQINVGSLYVSNKQMGADDFAAFQSNAGGADFVLGGTTTDAALMSLGNINATNVTFDGGRIVIDTERLKYGDDKMGAGSIHVRTTDAGQVVLGYNGYDESSNTYGETTEASALASVTDKNGKEITDLKGYMWVEDIEQLQAVNTNLSGQYALRNSIDATATKGWADGGFKPIIGKDDGNDIAFTGKFDGLDYNIFNLNINRNTEGNVGLFSMVGNGAVIRNVTLVGGSIKGQNNVGALAGQVSGGAQISNIMNSASVTGSSNVGGIIGSADHGTTDQEMLVFENLVNTGTVQGASSVGGLIGSLKNGKLSGTSYNLGGVTGKGFNVGGLVGTASNAALGDGTNLIYNRLNVSGKYNVGGIVGSMSGTTVQKAENSGNVTAKGYTTGEYTYHTAHYAGGTKQEDVYIANAGGIAGKSDSTEGQNSEIKNVQNSGDVSSGISEENGYTYYTAGNVGGIVGSAVDTNITNATNEENDIRGAHNVGGIAGYFSGTGIITTGINSGGDVLATGARNGSGFVKEWVRAGTTGREEAIIGNMGGIAGYMDGDGVYIVSSANRGTVHSQDITGNTVLPVSQAANVGGIVGKIDRSKTLSKDQLGDKYINAAVSNSYNTGDVRGYMGVGGVAGMMYNGEIAGSYNLGTVNTTRNKDSFGSIGSNGSYYTVNMGGIVGDTTEGTRASAVLYDVYNKGQIGDETFTYYARHVGGIVGRLSGTVEKAYNTGAIYNGYNVVGGIAGWMFKGSITNAFNTGNITVVNNERDHASSQVGGIVGAASTNNINAITNVYNLGTLRSFRNASTAGANTVGGIIGIINGDGIHQVSVTNAYTTGNIWAGSILPNDSTTSYVGSIWGNSEVKEEGRYRTVKAENTYYIKPDPDLKNTFYVTTDNSYKAIEYGKRHDSEEWNFSFSSQTDGDVTIDSGQDWRIYDGNSLPILNAFLPNTEKYFSDITDGKEPMKGIASIQYGTAYDPLLTIINAKQDTQNLTFDWQELGASNAAGIAVYGANLTLNDFMATGGSGYFGGMIYSDGALSIAAESGGDVALGSDSQLYGSSVSISADGNVTIYGDVTATGNTQDGTTRKEGEYSSQSYLKTDGSISITGGSVDVYGQLTSAKEGETTKVPGINGMADGWTPGNVSDSTKPMMDIGDRFCYTTGESTATGSISITAEKNENASEDGHVNVYYGHQQKGFLDTAGSLTVSGSGDVYMDSDLSIGGNLSITSPGEMILDISNIGKVQKDNGTVTDSLTGLHTFLHHFDNTGGTGKISFAGTEGKAADAKITIDMWDDENNGFNLTKYNSSENDTLVGDLNNLNFSVSGADNVTAKDYTYIWVSTGEQLAGIQQAVKGNSSFLGYNFALKNDIDASAVEKYEAIGTGFTGTFDGRDHRIIGLNVTGGNAGIFDTIGADGKVEDLRVYSGIFNGIDNAGAVAGINNGTISNVTTFGNVVTAKGSSNSTKMPGDTADLTGTIKDVNVGAAGGIAGINGGTIDNVSASDAVTAADDEASANNILSTAGGIAGINEEKAVISNSSSDSAVNASAESTYALGGIAGVNAGELINVDSLGVTTGIYEVGDHNSDIDTQYSDNVGGIAGRNSGTVSEAYNESIVSGRDNVGGILGVNTAAAAEGEESPVQNVSNAARVTGEAAFGETSDYVGGLVGSNSGSITNGRNNGEITGNQYVGGLVGENGKNSTLSNLVNDEAASITGDNYVGGIAGRNYGTISANDKGLVNRGSIIGQMYVGGVAGSNEDGGIITNTISSIALHVKTPYTSGQNESTAPKYFGGVVGQNSGTINGATNASSVDVAADGATMVGGIIGENTESGKLAGDIANEGLVSGKSNVGGIIGSNENDGILNNDDKNHRLVVSNSGRVQAVGGGAAGIFYNNTGAINNADLTNTGMVIGGSEKDSITGGLFGTNSGNITNSTLTNNGTVYGGGTVGGLIGKNTGDISTSSLINSVDGKVIGLNNVGGLIGQNYGIITGGRTEKNEQGKNTDVGYYKYQIYNNGTIQVGKWNDSDQDGKIADGEIKTDSVSGSNIGGLVGLNGYDEETKKTGSITAAYNTGAIMAGSSNNVGGIAGSNTGTLDQVFNTVITGVNADGSTQYGSITGDKYVGGIVGSNEAGGTVSNAYNTSDINGGTDTVGGIAGNNAGEISTVFTTQENLIANNSENGAVDKGFVLSADTAKNSGSYTGFGLTGNGFSKESSDGIWKIYDGSSMALLKVFLTKAGVTDPNLVYNGQEQVIGIDSVKAMYGDVTIPPLGQNGHKDAGNYDDWLYSSQIAASGTEADGTFNPNHLGYDIVYTTENGNVGIKKAVITVTGNRVDRTYGSAAITSSTDGTGVFIGGNKDYGFTVTAENTDITDEMKAELTGSNLGFNTNEISDGALNTESGKTTNDVKDGGYTWNTDLTLSGTLKNNYTFGNGSDIDGDKTTVTGNSYVNKATITVDLIDVNRTYGNADINKTDTNINGNYGVTNIEGVINGDNYKENSFTVNVATDGALDTNPDDKRVTQNAGDYTYTGTVTGTNDRLNNNYNIVVNNSTDTNNIGTGTSTVSKATITVGLNEVERVYGSKDLSVGYVYGISSIDGNTNGDNYDIEAFEFHRDKDNALAGDTEGRVTQNVGEYTYTGTVTSSNTDLNTNYNIIVDENTGKSKVNKADLTITIVDVETTYGTAFDKGSYGYTFGEGDIVNNDTVDSLKAEINAITGGYHNRGEGVAPKETNDAGTYELTFENNLVEMGSTLQNYNIISVKNGTATVNKAVIEVSADDHQIYVGAPEPTYTGTKIEDLLVNGDSLNGTSYEYGPQDPVDTSQTGEPVKIGIHFTDGSYYAAGGDWNSAWDGFKNYEITFKPGTLTIKDLPAGMPDISDSERWNSLLRDTPWDRNENFRERKAEVHFLAGGMTL